MTMSHTQLWCKLLKEALQSLGTPSAFVRTNLDMSQTCKYACHMSKMIQLRNVPDSLHRRLKARAALEGLSLSDYLLREIGRVAERPTLEEIKERLRHRAAVLPTISPAEAVREERERQ
jgi:plasmid stability protein